MVSICFGTEGISSDPGKRADTIQTLLFFICLLATILYYYVHDVEREGLVLLGNGNPKLCLCLQHTSSRWLTENLDLHRGRCQGALPKA